jgi:hypothetical protein
MSKTSFGAGAIFAALLWAGQTQAGLIGSFAFITPPETVFAPNGGDTLGWGGLLSPAPVIDSLGQTGTLRVIVNDGAGVLTGTPTNGVFPVNNIDPGGGVDYHAADGDFYDILFSYVSISGGTNPRIKATGVVDKLLGDTEFESTFGPIGSPVDVELIFETTTTSLDDLAMEPLGTKLFDPLLSVEVSTPAIPEPSSPLLLGVGLAGLLVVGRQRLNRVGGLGV